MNVVIHNPTCRTQKHSGALEIGMAGSCVDPDQLTDGTSVDVLMEWCKLSMSMLCEKQDPRPGSLDRKSLVKWTQERRPDSTGDILSPRLCSAVS